VVENATRIKKFDFLGEGGSLIKEISRAVHAGKVGDIVFFSVFSSSWKGLVCVIFGKGSRTIHLKRGD
jgi:hypothetical protein